MGPKLSISIWLKPNSCMGYIIFLLQTILKLNILPNSPKHIYKTENPASISFIPDKNKPSFNKISIELTTISIYSIDNSQ